MKHSWLHPLAFTAALALPTLAMANAWNEVSDAGDLPVSSNQVTVPSPSIIFGNVASPMDADLFALRLTAGTAFSATTVSFGGMEGIGDTQLFLFDSTGHGIRYNDDRDFTDFFSEISFTPGSTGTYYLGISALDFNPRDAQGSFLYVRDQSNPVATPGASIFGPVASWAAAGGFADSGQYQINLAGAAPVPEPSTILMMALGLAGLLGARRWLARK